MKDLPKRGRNITPTGFRNNAEPTPPCVGSTWSCLFYRQHRRLVCALAPMQSTHKFKRNPPWTPTQQTSKLFKDRACQFQERKQNDRPHIAHHSILFEPCTARAVGRLFKAGRARHALFRPPVTLGRDAQTPQKGADCGCAHCVRQRDDGAL